MQTQLTEMERELNKLFYHYACSVDLVDTVKSEMEKMREEIFKIRLLIRKPTS